MQIKRQTLSIGTPAVCSPWPIVKDQMLTKPERLSIGTFAGRSSDATRVSWSLSTFLVVDDGSEDDDVHDGDVGCFCSTLLHYISFHLSLIHI